MFRAILFLTVFLFPIHSWAACSGPAGVEAEILYNSDHKTVQYCDGTSWIALGKADLTTALASLTDTNVSPTDGQVLTWDDVNSEWIASDTTSGWQVPDDAAVCSGGGITGTIRYNSGKIQVCNDTNWVDVGGAESGGVWSLTGNDITNTNTGNVGVGEPSPTTKLHVAGKTTTDGIVFKKIGGVSAPTSTAGWNYSGGNLDFSGGNVGIGTAGPDTLLTVNGAAKMASISITDGSVYNNYTNGTGDLIVQSSNGSDVLQLVDSGAATSVDANPIIEFLHTTALGGSLSRLGYLGYGSTSNEDMIFLNESSMGNISFRNDGNNVRMTIDVTGNVGIGTASPDVPLDVEGATPQLYLGKSGQAGQIRMRRGNDGALASWLGYTDATEAGEFNVFSQGGSATLNLGAQDEIVLRTGDTFVDAQPRMTIDGAGNVGIGTTNPQTILTISGNTTFGGKANVTTIFRAGDATSIDANLAIGATNGNRPFIAALDGVTGAASLDFYTDDNLRMRIDAATGNVGIGIAGPAVQLDVAGTIRTNAYPAIEMTHGDPQLRFWGSAPASLKWVVGVTGAATDDFFIYDSEMSTPRLLIDDTTGNVGIGTANPSERLDLGGGNISMGYERIDSLCAGAGYCAASCSAGKRVLGGGCHVHGGGTRMRISRPLGTSGWECYPDTGSPGLDAYAICANIR